MSEIVDSGHKDSLGMGMDSGVKASRLTIFYAGQVMVVDDFPADKAMEIMMLAGTGTHSDWIRKHSAPNQLAVAADLPLARKASLARFLEKRKERITARAAAESEHQTLSKQSKAWI